jgi:hypothetical protein
MNLRLTIAGLYIPAFIKKRKLRDLFDLTATAFDSDMPVINKLSYADCLKAYAWFSKTKAEEVIRGHKDIKEIKTRLYHSACQLGEKLRKDFHIATRADVLRLSKILYRVLGIEFAGNSNGEVIIRRCFFSQLYSPEVCALISALDEGLAAGLSGGGRLVFRERISEGNSCCRATFKMQDVLA